MIGLYNIKMTHNNYKYHVTCYVGLCGSREPDHCKAREGGRGEGGWVGEGREEGKGGYDF